MCHKSQDEELSESTKSLGFVESAPPFAPGTPKQEHDRIVLEIAAANTALAALRDEAKETGAKVSSLELLYDKLNSDLAREQTPYSQTDRTFYIVGWVLAEREDELSEIINEATAIYDLVLEDPPEGEEPPTMTRNNKFVTPFETLTDMFSRPNPADGIDPNPAMAPWYWIIFGMMMADAGYGVMMAILFTLFRKFKKPRGEFGKLITVLQFASVTTTFWGVMFGSYFGAEWLPPVLFTPLYSPMSMMIMCFVLGAAHISCGLIIKAIELIKHGEWQLALGQC
ncbi:MAG: V-type ATPase 116kDa subunit family protein, partial [Oscillospiraceae bacterium]